MKILIDLDSIKKNPEYELRRYAKYLPGNTKIKFECIGPLPIVFIPGENCFASVNQRSDGLQHWEGQLTVLANDFDFNKAIHQSMGILEFTVEQEQIEVTIKDTPEEYLYEYEKVFVTCNDCGASFKHSYLESDADNDNYSNNVCPVCGVWYCCDIEYETIEEALERKNHAEIPSNTELPKSPEHYSGT